MPANTPRGYPYPVGTDRLMDGDDAIKNLAQKTDTNLAYGVTSGVVTTPIPTALGTPVSVSFTFPVGLFPAAPWVVVSNWGSASPQVRYPLSVAGITNTGGTVYMAQQAGTLSAASITWLAHRP